MAPKKKHEAEDLEEANLTKSDELEHETNDESAEGGDEPVTISFQDAFKGPAERTFSQELHGKEFKKIAKRFKEKFHGTVL